MKLVLTVTVVAAILSHPLAAALTGECPPGTVESNSPPKCKDGYNPEERPNKGSGCWDCYSKHEDRTCPEGYKKQNDICCLIDWNFPTQSPECGDNSEVEKGSNGCWKCSSCREGFHKSSGHCCPDGSEWSPAPASFPAVSGKCCSKGHSLAVSKDGKSSACCVTGYTYETDVCIPPGEQREMQYLLTQSESIDQQTGPEPSPGPSCPACNKHKPVCPDVNSKDLGIQYGKCYVLGISNDRTVGRNTNGEYTVPGFFVNIPFKVCDEKHKCDSKHGDPVRHKDIFTLRDVYGLQDWTDGVDPISRVPGFFSRGNSHEGITKDPEHIAEFEARPSCFDGQYTICLGGVSNGAGVACPGKPEYFNMNFPNKGMCQRFVFKPITCPDEAANFHIE